MQQEMINTILDAFKQLKHDVTLFGAFINPKMHTDQQGTKIMKVHRQVTPYFH